MTGRTESTDLATPNALQTDQPLADAFVTKVSSTGAVLFTTYLGGNGTDEGWGIAVDSTGIYVAGETDSTNFPTKNAFLQHRLDDGFVTKLTLGGSALIYSSYLGGSKYDKAYGIAVDAARGAWVVGATTSSDFPIAGGPSAGQQRKFGGLWDAFLARIAPDGLSVAFSTFKGGPGYDFAYDVAIDRTGSVYATGSNTPGFPVTPGMRPCGPIQDAFVVRLKGRGTQAPYATCLGPGLDSVSPWTPPSIPTSLDIPMGISNDSRRFSAYHACFQCGRLQRLRHKAWLIRWSCLFHVLWSQRRHCRRRGYRRRWERSGLHRRDHKIDQFSGCLSASIGSLPWVSLQTHAARERPILYTMILNTGIMAVSMSQNSGQFPWRVG